VDVDPSSSYLFSFFLLFLVALVVNRKQKTLKALYCLALPVFLCHPFRQPTQQPSGNFLGNHPPFSGNPFFQPTLGNCHFIRSRKKSDLVVGDLVAGKLLVRSSIRRAGSSFIMKVPHKMTRWDKCSFH